MRTRPSATRTTHGATTAKRSRSSRSQTWRRRSEAFRSSPPAPLVLEPLLYVPPAPSSLVAVVNDMPSAPPPPVSYGIPSLSDDELPPFRRVKVGTRVAYAVAVAVLGMMCGGIGMTSLASGEDDAPIDAAFRPEARTFEMQKTALAGELREKASLKPPLRVVLRH